MHIKFFDGKIYVCKGYCGSHESILQAAKRLRTKGYLARIHKHGYDHPDESWDVYVRHKVADKAKIEELLDPTHGMKEE